MKLLHIIILMGIISFIFGGCKKPDFDKLVYESYNSSLAPEFRERYTIEVTVGKITYTSVSANDEDQKLNVVNEKTISIDTINFKEIQNKVYELGVIGCNSSDDCDGGGTQTLTGYKNQKTTFSNIHYGCDKDCSGFYELLKFLNGYRPDN